MAAEAGRGTLVAYVHPDHQASQRVARAGLTATNTVVDGKIRWQN